MANLSTGFPNSPFVDLSSGEVTPVWRRYLLTLDARTGGRLGTDSASLEAELAAETTARATGDAALAAGIAAEANTRAEADTAERAARIAGDNALAVAVANPTEQAARIAGDAALQAEIDALQAEIDALGSGGIYAPLCTGDRPPVLVGTVDGQAIMTLIG